MVDAEDAAQQLARRISHFRAQEERALREVKTMRTHLETRLQKPQVELQSIGDPLDPRVSKAFLKQNGVSIPSRPKRKLKVPRSREQLDFLAKQKRAREMHKLEVARQQKERIKLALAEQQAKEAARDHQRRCRKERIRAREQEVIEQRIERQRQLREAATKQHHERLMTERQRQHEALNRVAQMEEEERNLRLRLEALHVHREYMEQELCSNVPPTVSHRMTGSD
ncbi:Reticulocyte-binding protein 2 a [Phytophthora citrophthora]|uniref:Reticulocyte-binding protein 2 a n=1 Tax=Phytophthora citrophthora TaxID=4793 RepID=A0AAD9G3E4_9STRA|nr:Reticulocyte-binding protein 2 a [Phytophthora citrophthora]